MPKKAGTEKGQCRDRPTSRDSIAKRDQHDQEMETLSHIHNTEVTEKNLRLEQHLKITKDLKDQYEKEGKLLDKRKESELKKLVDEGYNDPEKLAKEIAKAFGLENG